MTKIEGYRIVTNPTENESYYYNAGEDEFSQPILKQGVYTIKYEKNPIYEFYKNDDSTGKQKQNIEEVLKKRYINDKEYYDYLYKKDGDSCEDKLAKCEASKMSVNEKGGGGKKRSRKTKTRRRKNSSSRKKHKKTKTKLKSKK